MAKFLQVNDARFEKGRVVINIDQIVKIVRDSPRIAGETTARWRIVFPKHNEDVIVNKEDYQRILHAGKTPI